MPHAGIELNLLQRTCAFIIITMHVVRTRMGLLQKQLPPYFANSMHAVKALVSLKLYSTMTMWCLSFKAIVSHLACMIQVIRDLLAPDKYVIVVEHDLSVLDYLSDFICCLYGKPGAYGVVTLPFSVREGINIFLAGFVPTENLRFREEGLTFKVAENAGEGDDDVKKFARYTYPGMSKTQVISRTIPCMLVRVFKCTCRAQLIGKTVKQSCGG